MAYQAIAQKPAANNALEIFSRAAGEKAYPWELPPGQQAATWRQSRLRPLLAMCLARDPAQRPSSAEVLSQVRKMGHQTMSTGGTGPSSQTVAGLDL